jgi:hypothetical protein
VSTDLLGSPAAEGSFPGEIPSWLEPVRSDRFLQLVTGADDSWCYALLVARAGGLPCERGGRPPRRRLHHYGVFVEFLMQYRCLVSQSLRAFRDDPGASVWIPIGSTVMAALTYSPEGRVAHTEPPTWVRGPRVRPTSPAGDWFRAAG